MLALLAGAIKMSPKLATQATPNKIAVQKK
jgi:hypothetical protein